MIFFVFDIYFILAAKRPKENSKCGAFNCNTKWSKGLQQFCPISCKNGTDTSLNLLKNVIKKVPPCINQNLWAGGLAFSCVLLAARNIQSHQII